MLFRRRTISFTAGARPTSRAGVKIPREDAGKVAPEEGSERGCASTDDAQLQLDDCPYQEVEARPTGVVGFAELHEVVCASYAGACDTLKD